MGLVNRLSRPGAYIEFVLPPALLAYFLWAWRVCTSPFLAEYIADGLDLGPLVAVTYRYAATGLIASVSAVFLRLYFLPTRFASPPVPPPCISNLEVIFEVPRPKDGKAGLITHDEAASGGPLVVFCNSDTCGGRWKPPRTRHCSECGRCRLGFDHHCLFVANCISAPILGPFTALLLLAPVTVLLLAAPVHRAVIYGARQAWASAGSNARVQAYWGWGWSWVVPAGPVARYAIGFLLAWSDIEAEDNDMGRVEIGLLWGIGNALALITAALAFWQVKQIFSGELGNDVMRARAYAKASDAVRVARAKGEQDTKALAAMERFTPEKWFFVPLEHDLYAGAVVPVLPTESPYNLGRHENFDLLVGRGRGWRWILPWNCVRSGMSTAEASVWPINGVVRARLEMEAARLLDNQSDNRT
ncbi:hypothetical protein CcaverHIS002_0108310 [Cutaneotrichosporon cavernicola]|uniref:Palmitoyltransferase n=1 Tax=Cutaneotrichosporon cavernicola TaxID=279322 RepID=A0AA48HZ15_9TREE|nr:uncharacterized protein CcaverHIS019_0108240 [Cutaneotrichosporon cavernicola]BEI80302.1 hypothetical protein CcaverHIS002_0108310 [Cutaneotrichosporon cavernicola]BEI88106.1 hypothetical protein CcaverHIS019_0108240 [Cutaneotrichosporon cavernicola]